MNFLTPIFPKMISHWIHIFIYLFTYLLKKYTNIFEGELPSATSIHPPTHPSTHPLIHSSTQQSIHSSVQNTTLPACLIHSVLMFFHPKGHLRGWQRKDPHPHPVQAPVWAPAPSQESWNKTHTQLRSINTETGDSTAELCRNGSTSRDSKHADQWNLRRKSGSEAFLATNFSVDLWER